MPPLFIGHRSWSMTWVRLVRLSRPKVVCRVAGSRVRVRNIVNTWQMTNKHVGLGYIYRQVRAVIVIASIHSSSNVQMQTSRLSYSRHASQSQAKHGCHPCPQPSHRVGWTLVRIGTSPYLTPGAPVASTSPWVPTRDWKSKTSPRRCPTLSHYHGKKVRSDRTRPFPSAWHFRLQAILPSSHYNHQQGISTDRLTAWTDIIEPLLTIVAGQS